MNDFAGKVAVVTGASRGIGAAVRGRFLSRSSSVQAGGGCSCVVSFRVAEAFLCIPSLGELCLRERRVLRRASRWQLANRQKRVFSTMLL